MLLARERHRDKVVVERNQELPLALDPDKSRPRTMVGNATVMEMQNPRAGPCTQKTPVCPTVKYQI